MRSVMVAIVLASALAIGCRGGFKTSGGGATTPDGFGKGATHSLVFSDEGGILTRGAIGALGIMAAPGLVENKTVKTEYNQGDNGTVRKDTTITGTVDPNKAKGYEQGMAAIADPEWRIGTANGGPSANLEIATRYLGGDTSGAQFDFGWAYHRMRKLGDALVIGFRAYAGFGYGKFTFHDRVLEQMDRGPPKFGTGTFEFLGFPTRVGLFVMDQTSDFTAFVGTETFAKMNVNFDGETVYHLGQRLQYHLGFIEASVGASGNNTESERSFALEIGAGF